VGHTLAYGESFHGCCYDRFLWRIWHLSFGLNESFQKLGQRFIISLNAI
jgi:hypothetical protein